MAKIYISVGTNIEPEQHIRAAVSALSQQFGELVLSSVYESESVGFSGDNFYNMVIGAHTDLTVAQVVALLKQIEAANGRISQQKKFTSRTLDLDLLTYDDLICQSPIELPRDELDKNAFVLWPMAEIEPESCHPTRQQSYGQLWQHFDKTKQPLWKVPFSF